MNEKCEGSTCEGCQKPERNTDLCEPPEEWAEYVKRWRKPMSKSTERIVVVTIRTDGKKCAKSCRFYNDNKNNSPATPWVICRLFGEDIIEGNRVVACRAAEIEVDESALEIADTIIETTRECEDQNYLAHCYRDFATAAGKVKG